jgi:hypothetical protein
VLYLLSEKKAQFIMRKLQLVSMAAVGASLLAATQSASAALSGEIATGLTTIVTDQAALMDLVWPVIITVTGAFVILRLFKRGTSKI